MCVPSLHFSPWYTFPCVLIQNPSRPQTYPCLTTKKTSKLDSAQRARTHVFALSVFSARHPAAIVVKACVFSSSPLFLHLSSASAPTLVDSYIPACLFMNKDAFWH